MPARLTEMSQDLFVELAELANLLGTINGEALSLRTDMLTGASVRRQERGKSALIRDLLRLSESAKVLAEAITEDQMGVHLEEEVSE